MKILTYQSDDFWRQLEEHLFIRDEETSYKIEADVKSIIREIREYGDDKVIQFAKDFDKIIIIFVRKWVMSGPTCTKILRKLF